MQNQDYSALGCIIYKTVIKDMFMGFFDKIDTNMTDNAIKRILNMFAAKRIFPWVPSTGRT